MSSTYLFLTNGRNFIGPYLEGETAISRGYHMLREPAEGGHGPDTAIHAVRAADIDAARQAWRLQQDREARTARQGARRG